MMKEYRVIIDGQEVGKATLTAEQVVYFNRNDEEIPYSKDLNNREVIDHGTMIDTTVTLEIYLDV